MFVKKKTNKYSVIACGVFCAGAAGFLAPAAVFAHDNSTTDNQVAQAQTNQDEELSREITRFNKQGGSLEGRGTNGSDAPGDAQMPAGDDSSASHPEADELSGRINRFNNKNSSLENRDADGSNLSQDKPMPAGSGESANHPEADELSEEIRRYNSNGGSLRDNAAAGSEANNGPSGSMSTGANASPSGGDNSELSNRIEQHNKNAH